jgi:hypothetical protein
MGTFDVSIDFEKEEIVHFRDARDLFPGRRSCLQPLHRLRPRCVRGTKLETCLIGGLRYTSRVAVARFIAAQNAGQAPPGISASQRSRLSAAARRELENIGI